MKMEVPQVDLPLEVLAWTKVTEDILNIYKQSCRLQACIFAICTEGTMKVSINLLEYEVHPNDLITLLPGTIIQFREKAEKVSLCFAGFSAKCIGHINLLTTIGSAYPKLIEQPIIPLSENISEYLKEYFALLSHASCDESFKMNSKLADLSLQTILTSVQLMYRNYSGNNHSNRKKEICRKLGISLQHLSTTVKQVTGKSVLDTIAYIVIIDAKAQLKGTDMTIQEIAYSLNFPNPSFFCKFFRRHVGMSPLEFRNS